MFLFYLNMNYFSRLASCRRMFRYKFQSCNFSSEGINFPRENSILTKVVENLEKEGRKIILTADDAKKCIIPVLLKYGFKDEEIITFMSSAVEFLTVPGKKLSPILQTFTNFGITPDSALIVLVQEPTLLDVDEELLVDQLTLMKQIIPNRKTLNSFIEKNANLILQPLKPILRLKNNLRSFFTIEQVGYMVNRAPELLLRKFEELEKIYEYLYYVMGLEPTDVFKTNWFQYTLQEIRIRHEVAVRTGVYKRPDPKRPAKAADNPLLKDIIDTNDNQFAKICGISLNELKIFREMYTEKMADEDSVNEVIEKQKRFDRPWRGKPDKSYNEENDFDDDFNEEDQHTKTDDKPTKVIKQWLNPRRPRY